MENVKKQYVDWYRCGLWDKQKLALAVARGQISAADYTEITGEDGTQLSADAPPTYAELVAENKLLQQKAAALADQNDFQEELIVEMAEVVYA